MRQIKKSAYYIICAATLFLNCSVCLAEIETFAVSSTEGAAVPTEFMEKPETEEGVEVEKAEATPAKAPEKKGTLNYIFSHLHTHAETDIAYNDNVYLLHKKTNDIVTTVRPGVSLLLGSKELNANGKPRSYCEIDAGYKTDCYIREKLNHNNPYATVNVQGVGPHYKMSFNNWFLNDVKPTQSISTNRSGLTGYQLNVTGAKFDYTLKRAELEVEYKRRQLDYKGYPFRDNNSVVKQNVYTTLSINPAITPRMKYFFEYDYGTWVYDYAANNLGNFTEHYFWLGFKGQLMNKVFGDFKAGKLFRLSYVAPGKYKDAFVFSGNLYYKYSRKLFFALRFSREQDPATNKSLGFNTGYTILGRVIYNYNNQLSFQGGPKYWYDGYKTAGTHDNTYGAFIRMDYRVNRSTTIGVEYNYIRRDTTRANAKYNNSNIIARMEMAF